MQKIEAVASLGQHRLMLPGWVKAALSPNDRLKVYLTVLQSASSHASHPDRDLPDLRGWYHGLSAVRPGAVGSCRFTPMNCARRRFQLRSNDRVERPATTPLAACRGSQLPVGNQGAVRDDSRSAPTIC